MNNEWLQKLLLDFNKDIYLEILQDKGLTSFTNEKLKKNINLFFIKLNKIDLNFKHIDKRFKNMDLSYFYINKDGIVITKNKFINYNFLTDQIKYKFPIKCKNWSFFYHINVLELINFMFNEN